MMQPSQNFHSNVHVSGTNIPAPKSQLDYEQITGLLAPTKSAKGYGTTGVINAADLQGNPLERFSCNSSQIQEFGGRRMAYDTSSATPIPDSQYSRRTRSQRHSSDDMSSFSTHQVHQVSTAVRCLSFSADSIAGTCSHSVDAPEWNNDADTGLLAQPSPSTTYNNSNRQSESNSQQSQNQLWHYSNDLASRSPTRTPSEVIIQIPTNAIQQVLEAVTPHIQQPDSYFGDAQYNAPEMQYGCGPRQSPYSPVQKSPSILPKSDSTRQKRSFMPVRVRRERKARKNKEHTPHPTPLEGAVRFVNFTLNDSEKILSGVNPGGSSKTRAKRQRKAI